jgi:hypothetical protein
VAPVRSGQSAYKFFSTRRPIGPLKINLGSAAGADFLEYPNVSPRIGMLISRDKSLAAPLFTTLGLEDMYDLVEIVLIDAHNDRVLEKLRKSEDY